MQPFCTWSPIFKTHHINHLTTMFLNVWVCDRQVNWKRKDLPCGCLLWTPQRYFLLPRFDWSCATSGSTWDLSRKGSWPWSAPDRRPLSPTLYHKAALSAWIGPGETWRERRGEKSYYEARCQPAAPCKAPCRLCLNGQLHIPWSSARPLGIILVTLLPSFSWSLVVVVVVMPSIQVVKREKDLVSTSLPRLLVM